MCSDTQGVVVESILSPDRRGNARQRDEAIRVIIFDDRIESVIHHSDASGNRIRQRLVERSLEADLVIGSVSYVGEVGGLSKPRPDPDRTFRKFAPAQRQHNPRRRRRPPETRSDR